MAATTSRENLNFLWRACRNVLPTAVELIHKKVHIIETCSWCRMFAEDAVHILFTCSFARDLIGECGYAADNI